ncbi:Ras guanine nucleotide exchange factor [Pelomyxa schiedti]|nr:Ras guanine nucleotide exchange factor [Pelomyxa schiedti]
MSQQHSRSNSGSGGINNGSDGGSRAIGGDLASSGANSAAATQFRDAATVVVKTVMLLRDLFNKEPLPLSDIKLVVNKIEEASTAFANAAAAVNMEILSLPHRPGGVEQLEKLNQICQQLKEKIDSIVRLARTLQKPELLEVAELMKKALEIVSNSLPPAVSPPPSHTTRLSNSTPCRNSAQSPTQQPPPNTDTTHKRENSVSQCIPPMPMANSPGLSTEKQDSQQQQPVPSGNSIDSTQNATVNRQVITQVIEDLKSNNKEFSFMWMQMSPDLQENFTKTLFSVVNSAIAQNSASTSLTAASIPRANVISPITLAANQDEVDVDDSTQDLEAHLRSGHLQRVITRNKLGSLSTNHQETESPGMALRDTILRILDLSAKIGDLVFGTAMNATACIAEPRNEDKNNNFESAVQSSRNTIIKILESCRIKVTSEIKEGEGCDLTAILEVFDKTVRDISESTVKGKPDTTVDVGPNTPPHKQQLIEGEIEKQCFYYSNRVRIHLCQFLSIVSALCFKISTSSWLLELSATSMSFVNAITLLSNCVATARAVLSQSTENPMDAVSTTPSVPARPLQELIESAAIPNDIPLWEELTAPPPYQIFPPHEVKAATLNKLVELATSCTFHDAAYLKTFVIMSCSFTTPSKLFLKLIQRYEVPPETDPALKTLIQTRVLIFLKYWIDHQFDEMDDTLIRRLSEFADRLLADGLGAQVFKSDLESKKRMRMSKIKDLLIPHVDLVMPQEKISPISYILCMSSEEIAKQLTLIDFGIFQSIKPSELVDKGWTKEGKNYRSPHVVQMIERINNFSLWLSQMIVFEQNQKVRADIVTKFMEVSCYLKSINNFHTLMAVIVGLNQATVTRLKQTMALVPEKTTKKWKAAESVMDVNGNFKTYRSTLTQAAGPILPYLIVYLSDLTFIADGNADTVNNMINFDKRSMVHQIISKIDELQHNPYKGFVVCEPLNTFLSELPALTDNTLYNISKLREPPLPTSSATSKTSSRRKSAH